jgi:hypothetical protein
MFSEGPCKTLLEQKIPPYAGRNRREAAVLECKKRDINTPEVREALDLLEPHVRPPRLT